MKITLDHPKNIDRYLQHYAMTSATTFYGGLYAAAAIASAAFYAMPFINSLIEAMICAFLCVVGPAAPAVVYRFDRKMGRPHAVIIGTVIAIAYVLHLAALSITQGVL